MAPSKQRFVVVGILAMALLVAMVLARGFQWTWVQMGWDDPLPFSLKELPLTALLAYVVAFVAAFVCLKNPVISQLAYEVVDELTRVTWPSREETGNATVVVIVTVLICSAYLGVFDAFWLWLTDWILGVTPTGA